MSTGSKVKKNVKFNKWVVLKSVTGKHLEVTVTEVSHSPILLYDLRARQGGVNTLTSKEGILPGSSLSIEKKNTWPSGGIQIRFNLSRDAYCEPGPDGVVKIGLCDLDEIAKPTVCYRWKSGKDV